MQFARGAAAVAGAGALVLVAGLAPACARDEGASVRNVGDEASASGTGAGSGSATGSGTAASDCAPVGDAKGADERVLVKMTEFKIEPADSSADAGKVNFHIENAGKEPHELVVVKGDDPAALPTGEDGSVDEEKLPEGAFIGEVEPFSGGLTCDGTFELSEGPYVLFCNIVEKEEDGTLESHYQEGMRTAFTVD